MFNIPVHSTVTGDVVGLMPREEPLAPGERFFDHPDFGVYSTVRTEAGTSGPIFKNRLGFAAWNSKGRPSPIG